MLTIPVIRAVGKSILLAFATVLFCTGLSAQDISLDQLESGMNELIYRVSRSVVSVESFYSFHSNTRDLVENEAVYNVISTGVIFDSLGHVLTVASPVMNRSKIQVRFEDQTIPAELTAIDYRNGLAVLKLAHPVGTAVEFSRQRGCAGQIVIAVGNSYGLRAAPSMGFCAGVRPDGAVQFTAPITSGTLGGGLFDLSGRLVGVIVGGVGPENRAEAGLAVPSYRALESGSYLIHNGSRAAGYLGLSTAEIEVFPPLEISPGNQVVRDQGNVIIVERGVVVTSVVPTSPASRAGLRKGDLLFSVNERLVPSALQLADLVRDTAPGTVLEFGVIRQNRPYYLPVRVGQAEVGSIQSSVSFFFESVETMSAPDSLLQEIEALKETIRYLEVRLNQLR